MHRHRKLISGGLVFGFAALTLALNLCVLMGAESCPIADGAPTAESPVVVAGNDCCLTCASNSALLDSPGFAASAITMLPLAQTASIPAAVVLGSDIPAAAAPEIPSFPIFLRNLAFLI